MRDIVLKLRELRRVNHLTQEQAAARSSIGVKTISSFETGERIDSLKLSQLRKLLGAYGVTEVEFFGGGIDRLIAELDEEGLVRVVQRSADVCTDRPAAEGRR